jgi:ubiquinone/menaquinone biosynthesis C-methylase UbiE
MARRNQDVNRWAVELLTLQATDRVLDLGCGPGVGVALAAELVTDGFVAGVDPSPLMVSQATEGNRTIIELGRVEIHHASALQLPFPEGSFTKAFAVNNVAVVGGARPA